MSRYGAPSFPSLLKDCVLWFTGEHSTVNTTGKTITAYGNATQSTAVLDPWGEARPVGYFDGNGDYLTVGTTSSFNFLHQVGTAGKWSIRFWYKWGNPSSAFFGLLSTAGSRTNHGIRISINPNYRFGVSIMRGVDNTNVIDFITTVDSVPNDTNWHYVVITYDQALSESNCKFYLDKVLIGSGTKLAYEPSTSNSTYVLHIGTYYSTSYPLLGYLSDVQIFDGICIDGTTVPTSRFKPDSYTKLLLHMYGSGSTFTDDPFVDIDEFPIIPSGVTVTNYGTWTKDDLGNNKSVLKFDGSTRSIGLISNTAFNFMHQVGTSGKWTVSCWYRWNNRTTDSSIFSNTSTLGSHGFFIWGDTTRYLHVAIAANVHPNKVFSGPTSSPLPDDSNWHHIVIMYDQSLASNNCKVYCDLVDISISSSKTAYTPSTANATNSAAIGAWQSGIAGNYNGNICQLMVFNGRILTLPEIKLLMNRTHPITGRGLIDSGRYWRLTT